jgi:hypothetical protein
VLANVRFLAAYRHQARVPAELAAWVGGRAGVPVSIAELEAAWPEQADGIRSAALHLLWRGVLTADLTRPLSAAAATGRSRPEPSH